MLIEELDCRVSAFLRVELTHARADSNLYRTMMRVNYPLARRRGVRWPGSIRHRSPQGGGRRGGGGGVVKEVFKVFSLDWFFSVAEQNIETWVEHVEVLNVSPETVLHRLVEQIIKVFSKGPRRCGAGQVP